MDKGFKISIIIPVYNNYDSLSELTRRLSSVSHLRSEEFEVVYVNDGSTDNSFFLLRDLAAEYSFVKVVNLSRNFGQHPAICAGFEHASGNTIVLMDADLQDRPEDINALVEKLVNDDVDIVYTIKESSIKKITSRFSSVIYHFIFSRIVGSNVPVNIGTFRVFNRKFLEALLQYQEVNVLYGPLMFYMGFKSSFLSLPYLDRQSGQSSYTFIKRLELAINSLISYTDIPHKISTMFGLSLLIGSFIYGILIVIQYLLFGVSLPDGTTMVLLVLFLTLGSIMFSLGLIGSYVFRVYQEVLHRPRYLVQDRINI
jgi:dolichol-phosphate mannosyltransferase